LVLGIDTATRHGGAALVDSAGVVGEIVIAPRGGHGRTLMSRIDFLLAWSGVGYSDIQGLAVSIGPGSFTGVRVGLSSAKGLSMGLGLSLAAVSGFDAMARLAAWTDMPVWVVLDAKRGQVFAAAYSKGGRERIQEPGVYEPNALGEIIREKGEKVLVCGDGALRYGSLLAGIIGDLGIFIPGENNLQRPASVAWIGRERLMEGVYDDPASVVPMYLRGVDIRKNSAP